MTDTIGKKVNTSGRKQLAHLHILATKRRRRCKAVRVIGKFCGVEGVMLSGSLQLVTRSRAAKMFSVSAYGLIWRRALRYAHISSDEAKAAITPPLMKSVSGAACVVTRSRADSILK